MILMPICNIPSFYQILEIYFILFVLIEKSQRIKNFLSLIKNSITKTISKLSIIP
jgi:hypothetical protein